MGLVMLPWGAQGGQRRQEGIPQSKGAEGSWDEVPHSTARVDETDLPAD